MTQLALQVDGLSKSYRVRRPLLETLRHPRAGARIAAIDNLSCEVNDGEFFGFLGENGAGKTTLFRILSTLVIPDRGSVRVLGTEVTRDPALIRRLVAPVPASERSLSWRLSAAENLRLYAALYRVSSRDAAVRITDLLEVVGLTEVGSRLVGTFSSGMKQRLLLARALMARPRVLLLDEPTRSLDPIAARAFRQFLKEDVGHGQGCSILLATHDPDEVRELCDRVGVLHRGRLLGVGTPATLAAQLGYHRFRLVTTEPGHPAIERLAQEGVRLGRVEDLDDGWLVREMDLPEGERTASVLLASLVQAGVPVSRFERVELPLAELLERVTRPTKAAAHA
jgi:ABC-2 type transport system ATP-binding protein